MKNGWRTILIYVGIVVFLGWIVLAFLTKPGASFTTDTIDAEKSRAMVENYEKLKENYPLIESLPIEVDRFLNYSEHIHYKITYRVENGEAVIVVTDYTGGNLENARKNIENRGFEPDNYEIEYIDSSSDVNL